MLSRLQPARSPARVFILLLLITFASACSDNSSPDTPASNEPAIPMDGSTAPGDVVDADSPAATPLDDMPVAPTMDAPASLQDQLQRVVDEAVESGLPGVSLHLQQGDASVSVVAGVVNRDTAEPVTPASLFQLASIGKTYVATMFMRFVSMGMLQLDDPIDRWLDPAMSDMITDADMITVEMLLAHTSGIPDYLNDSPDYIVDFAESRGKVWTASEVLGYIDGRDNFFVPGEEFRYSNTNYLLLGVIAERVTGVPLGTALRQWVFEPAGLQNTYGAFEELGQPELAHGYVPVSIFEGSNLDVDLPADGSDLDTFDWLKADGFGDAPVHSTPSDMNLFIRTLIDTDALVSGELKTRMLTESFPGSSEYGLGIVVVDDPTEPTLYGHEGQFFGLSSLLLYAPSLDTSVATTVNASNGAFEPLYAEYLDQMFSVLENSAQEPAGNRRSLR